MFCAQAALKAQVFYEILPDFGQQQMTYEMSHGKQDETSGGRDILLICIFERGLRMFALHSREDEIVTVGFWLRNFLCKEAHAAQKRDIPVILPYF